MKYQLAISTFLAISLASIALGNAPVNRLEESKTRYFESVVRARTTFNEAIKRTIGVASSPEAKQRLREQVTAFEAGKSLPSNAPLAAAAAEYQRSLRQLDEELLAVYDETISALTRAVEIDEAAAIRDERDALAKSLKSDRIRTLAEDEVLTKLTARLHKHSELRESLRTDLLEKMNSRLTQIASTGDLDRAQDVQAAMRQIEQSGEMESETVKDAVINAAWSRYRKLLDLANQRLIASYDTTIAAYVRNGEVEKANRMRIEKKIKQRELLTGIWEWSFDDAGDLRDFHRHGDVRIHRDGGLECLKGQPRSSVATRQRFTYPIQVELDVRCEPDGALDIFPRILDTIKLSYGGNHNTATSVVVGDDATPVQHKPIIGGHTYKITISVDEYRRAVITRDGVELFNERIPEQVPLEGPVLLDGGIGHVVYERVRVMAVPADGRFVGGSRRAATDRKSSETTTKGSTSKATDSTIRSVPALLSKLPAGALPHKPEGWSHLEETRTREALQTMKGKNVELTAFLLNSQAADAVRPGVYHTHGTFFYRVSVGRSRILVLVGGCIVDSEDAPYAKQVMSMAPGQSATIKGTIRSASTLSMNGIPPAIRIALSDLKIVPGKKDPKRSGPVPQMEITTHHFCRIKK